MTLEEACKLAQDALSTEDTFGGVVYRPTHYVRYHAGRWDVGQIDDKGGERWVPLGAGQTAEEALKAAGVKVP